MIATTSTAVRRKDRSSDSADDGVGLADPERGPLEDIVDVDHMGLDDDPGSWAALGAELGRRLDDDGVATLPGFLRGGAVASIADELRRAQRFTPIIADDRSVYGGVTVAGEHAALSATSPWVAGHVTRDMIPAYSPAQRLYVSPLVKRLIAACVGVDHVYEYADPLAGLVATVLPPGGCYGWHYDTNEYVVTIGVQQAASGGEFEFQRDLRTVGDENLDGVAAVLNGSAEPGRRSRQGPGDLQVFRGRYSLHRVTEVTGDVARLTLVLAYAARPGQIGPVERTRRVYGRVTEAHLVAEHARYGADGLIR